MRLGVIMLGISFIVWVACLSAFGWCVQENVHFAFGIVCEFVGKYYLLMILSDTNTRSKRLTIVYASDSEHMLQRCLGNNSHVFDQ